MKIRQFVCLILCLAMVAAFVGCRKNPSETSYLSDDVEIIYIDKPTDSSNDSAGDGSDNSQSDNNNPGGNTSDTGTVNIGTKPDNTPNKIDPGRIKDLKGRKIVYVAWWEASDRNTEEGKKLREVEKLLNCTFVERKMSDYKALYTSILSGAPIADLFCPNTEGPVLNLASKGYLIPLDTLSNFNLSDECWDKACTAENTLDGHVYAISNVAQVRSVLMYNKTMFKKNNWEDLYQLQSKGQLTWDKLTEIMSKAATVNGNDVTRYGLVPVYTIKEFGRQLLWANGAKIITRQGDTKNFTYTLENTKATTALNQLRDWVSNKGYIYDSYYAGWDTGRQVFYSGKAAMAVVDYNQFQTIYSNADFEIGMVLFPHGPNGSNDLVQSQASATAIPKGVKNPNDVALFWNILGEYRNNSVTMVDQSIYDAMPDPSVKATIEKYLYNLQTGKYVFDNGYYMDGVLDTIDKVAKGETTSAAALSSIKQKINAEITDYWK